MAVSYVICTSVLAPRVAGFSDATRQNLLTEMRRNHPQANWVGNVALLNIWDVAGDFDAEVEHEVISEILRDFPIGV